MGEKMKKNEIIAVVIAFGATVAMENADAMPAATIKTTRRMSILRAWNISL